MEVKKLSDNDKLEGVRQLFKLVSREGALEMLELLNTEGPKRFSEIKNKVGISDKQIAIILNGASNLKIIEKTIDGWQVTKSGKASLSILDSMEKIIVGGI